MQGARLLLLSSRLPETYRYKGLSFFTLHCKLSKLKTSDCCVDQCLYFSGFYISNQDELIKIELSHTK